MSYMELTQNKQKLQLLVVIGVRGSGETAGQWDANVELKEDDSPPTRSNSEQAHMSELTVKTRPQAPRCPV